MATKSQHPQFEFKVRVVKVDNLARNLKDDGEAGWSVASVQYAVINAYVLLQRVVLG